MFIKGKKKKERKNQFSSLCGERGEIKGEAKKVHKEGKEESAMNEEKNKKEI